MKTNREQRFAGFEAKRQQHKAEQAVKDAEWRAEGAEEYATMLTWLADYVVDAAAYTTMDAALLREEANATKERVKLGS